MQKWELFCIFCFNVLAPTFDLYTDIRLICSLHCTIQLKGFKNVDKNKVKHIVSDLRYILSAA